MNHWMQEGKRVGRCSARSAKSFRESGVQGDLFIRANGRIKGPFSNPDILRLARNGTVRPEHEISVDRRNWMPAGEYPGLFQGVAVAAPDAPPSGSVPINGDRVIPPPIIASRPAISSPGTRHGPADARLANRPPDLGFEVRVQGLGREVTDRATGKRRMLIQDINMTLKPGEFVALVGASGAGKSTLFGAISGRVRGTHGRVRYDAQDLYGNFEFFRQFIGYVPQRDVFHDVLPVIDALRATSRLRLPSETTADDIDANIDRVLKIVSLSEKRNSIISNLSGGEQKRVAIALELLSRPRILFLDEPTAPLDPRTTVQMMQLFRTLAEGGITVIMITHAANSLAQCDSVAYMHKGMLTFFGTPEQLKDFFGVKDMGDAYVAEERQSPERWRAAYRDTAAFGEFIVGRDAGRPVVSGDNTALKAPAGRNAGRGLAVLWNQTRILTRRYVRVLTVDRRNLAIMIALAPVVAAMLCLATSSIDTSNKLETSQWFAKQKILCFGSVTIVTFLALFASVREIVKELPIYLHEHFINVEVIPYLLSKIIPLLFICAAQTALVVAVINLFGGIEAGKPLTQFVVLFGCSAVGSMIGLMISALVTQSDQAVTGMIIVVIPEILFSGSMVAIKGVTKLIAAPLITDYWGLNGMISQLPQNMIDKIKIVRADADALRGNGVVKCCTMMALQFLGAVLITYFLMILKDSTSLYERFLTQPKKKSKRKKKSPGGVPQLANAGSAS
jgi:ABC-type multidrug transport system ATPase subunit